MEPQKPADEPQADQPTDTDQSVENSEDTNPDKIQEDAAENPDISDEQPSEEQASTSAPEVAQPIMQESEDMPDEAKPVTDENPGTPAVAPGVVTASATESATATALASTPKKNKKKLLLIAVPALILVLAAGYLFGIYIPNQPENVWKTGVNRTGETLKTLTEKTASKESIDKLEKAEVNGSVDVDAGEKGRFSGTITSKYDKTQSNSKLTFKSEGEDSALGRVDFSLEALTKIADGEKWPDVYLKSEGQEDLALDYYLPFMSGYDGEWIAVDSSYLEDAFSNLSQEEIDTNYNSQEISDLAKILSETTAEYMFTKDPEKAMLENRGFQAKEDVDGVKSYKYKAALNPDNTVKYCKSMLEKLSSSEAYKKLIGNPGDEEMNRLKDEGNTECDAVKDDFNKDETFDLWIDAKYKVINKVRIYESQDNQDKYLDIGQGYKGGDEIPFYVDFSKMTDGYEEGRVSFKYNNKDSSSKIELNIKYSDEYSGDITAKGSLEIKPLNEELNIQQPSGAINIEEFITNYYTNASYDDVLGTQDYSTPFGLFE